MYTVQSTTVVHTDKSLWCGVGGTREQVEEEEEDVYVHPGLDPFNKHNLINILINIV